MNKKDRDVVKNVFKNSKGDVIDASKETNLTAWEIGAQIKENDPMWRRKQKFQLV